MLTSRKLLISSLTSEVLKILSYNWVILSILNKLSMNLGILNTWSFHIIKPDSYLCTWIASVRDKKFHKQRSNYHIFSTKLTDPIGICHVINPNPHKCYHREFPIGLTSIMWAYCGFLTSDSCLLDVQVRHGPGSCPVINHQQVIKRKMSDRGGILIWHVFISVFVSMYL